MHSSYHRGHPSKAPVVEKPALPEYFNYGLDEHTYRRFMNSEMASEWEEKFMSRIQRPAIPEQSPSPRTPAMHSMKLGEEAHGLPQSVPHWEKPMRFVLPQTAAPRGKERVMCEFPSINPDAVEVAVLEDGYLSWREHYTSKYGRLGEGVGIPIAEASNEQMIHPNGKPSGFRKLKKISKT
ncbi:hypothetical protein XU18_4467 [Perkinsela sp. CCAP 1560/4]|nr:hypothetical protein XU18_4467 [Perkinsela sp. CCAP 1560/4]|eukprot:KNH04257.1 hypothetical protein XU18_4467 [Perkinsela sp. CCAP 1560/4]